VLDHAARLRRLDVHDADNRANCPSSFCRRGRKDKLKGLKLGADDYITAVRSSGSFINAVLRRFAKHRALMISKLVSTSAAPVATTSQCT
jgi:hypothetical protein